MEFSTICLEDYALLSSDLSQIEFDSKCIINTVNQYSYVVAEKDSEFKEALKSSDILIPDGIGIVAAVKLVNNNIIKKITGSDLHLYFLEKLNSEKASCFYLGSTEHTLSKIISKVNKEFPHVRVGSYSPPFKPIFSDKDNAKIISMINEFEPDVLFIGMSAPKQEKWSYLNKDKLNVGIVCSIGAVFDFFAGTINRPSKFWQKLGLEWLRRLLKEPRRLFKRYVIYGPLFIYMLLRMWVNKLFLDRLIE